MRRAGSSERRSERGDAAKALTRPPDAPPEPLRPPPKNQPWVGGKGTVRPRGCEQREQEEAWKGWNLRERFPAPRGGGQERFWGAAPAPRAAEGACGFQVWGQVVPAGTPGATRQGVQSSRCSLNSSFPSDSGPQGVLGGRAASPALQTLHRGRDFSPGREGLSPPGWRSALRGGGSSEGQGQTEATSPQTPPRGLCWLPPAAELSRAFPDE